MNPRWLLPLLLVSACDLGSRPPPDAPSPAPTSWTSETEVHRAIIFTPNASTAVSPSISVSDDIARLCRLEVDNMGRAPKFALDRSELLPADNDVLDRIARCYNDGTLGYVSLQLIGRADPRGTEKHNIELGAQRAHAVATALQARGVDATKIYELSRGALDATGTDEASWAMDRRVDIIAFRLLGVEE